MNLAQAAQQWKYIIKQKETKKNTVTDDSNIENKGPSEIKYICGKGYKKYTYGLHLPLLLYL